MDHLNKTLNHFWKRWKMEYLLELRESHRYGPKTDPKNISPSEGDVVLMHSDSKLRGFWKLVKVHQLIKGHDGLVRGAIVRVPTKEGKTTLLRRPLRCLYPLECNSGVGREQTSGDEVNGRVTADETVDEDSMEVSRTTRSVLRDEGTRRQRQAALRANSFIEAVMGDEN